MIESLLAPAEKVRADLRHTRTSWLTSTLHFATQLAHTHILDATGQTVFDRNATADTEAASPAT